MSFEKVFERVRRKVQAEGLRLGYRLSLSNERMRYLRFRTFLPFLVLLCCIAVWPQLSVPGSGALVPQSEAPKDAFGRSTPRGTVMGFLNAAHKGDHEVAAKYLNTRSQGKAAANLARQLAVVLDHRLPARLNEISDKPQGSAYDPLKPDQDLVGTISSSNGNVDILVERVDQGKAGSVWLFSRKTLESIPGLYEEVNTVSPDDVLPEFLVTTRVADIALFHWLAIFVGMPLFYLATLLLNRLLKLLIRRLRLRLGKADLPYTDPLPKPVQLLLLALVIRWIVSNLRLPLLARQFWFSIAAVITIAACVWLMIMFNGWAEAYALRRLHSHQAGAAASILRLFRRVIDLLIVFAGIVVVLHHFGLNATAALAGLGVGGIAVALAAQKTLENVIGGASIIFDRAVRVGDFLKLGDISGTVDYIGLRSTKIRTTDRTEVSVPNGQIANMSLEIISSRDKFSFRPLVGLRYETTPVQIRAVLTGIRELLAQHPSVDQDSVRVRFVRFGSFSLDLDVFAYIFAPDWVQFLEIQEGLLFSVMEIVQRAGAQIAFPSQTMYVETHSSDEEDALTAVAKSAAGDTKSGHKAAAKSA
jgi:MscS family membrane protein